MPGTLRADFRSQALQQAREKADLWLPPSRRSLVSQSVAGTQIAAEAAGSRPQPAAASAYAAIACLRPRHSVAIICRSPHVASVRAQTFRLNHIERTLLLRAGKLTAHAFSLLQSFKPVPDRRGALNLFFEFASATCPQQLSAVMVSCSRCVPLLSSHCFARFTKRLIRLLHTRCA